MLSREERVALFMSLFKGRDDVFARRWEKWDGSVSGYAPVYVDSDKESYVPLTAGWIEKHLIGAVTLGVYPLLKDNTSNFIAADFDGEGWRDTVREFLDTCKKYGLPVTTERSRSGNGAHVWCFFKAPYPAYRSRRIFLSLLREAGCIDALEKGENFDRLFPNQNQLSGKGLGNLIALPLQGASRKLGNSVFVDSDDDFSVIPDQWQFLKDVPRADVEKLDKLFFDASGAGKSAESTVASSGVLVLVLDDAISISRQNLPPAFVSFLREELNLLNIGYLVKERAGLPTYGEKKFINTLEQDGEFVRVPRGFLRQLCAWLDEHGTPYEIRDARLALDQVEFDPSHKLFPYQQAAAAAFDKVEQGVLVAPAGAGKTLIGLEIIARKRQPAIILTHRREIFEQWIERIEHGMSIPKSKIGKISSTKKDPRHPITVAMVQTIARMKDVGDITSRFGTILVDECHHMPSRMFRDVVSKFPGRFRFGLTATPSRKYNDEKLIAVYLGDIIYVIGKEDMQNIAAGNGKNIHDSDAVVVRTTDLRMPFGTTPRDFQLLSKVLSNDATRNALVAHDITSEARTGKKCLVLTERKEHTEMLRAYVRRDFETVMFSGDLSMRQRRFAVQKIKSGRFRILIATGQILGEGTDIADLEVLFLVFPVSFHGKLAQYIGRIQRAGGPKRVYDYRDANVPLLERLWKKRAAFYRKSGFSIEQ